MLCQSGNPFGEDDHNFTMSLLGQNGYGSTVMGTDLWRVQPSCREACAKQKALNECHAPQNDKFECHISREIQSPNPVTPELGKDSSGMHVFFPLRRLCQRKGPGTLGE